MAPPKIEAVETVPDVATFRYTSVIGLSARR